MSIQDANPVNDFGCLVDEPRGAGALSATEANHLLGCNTEQSTERRMIILRVLCDEAPMPKTEFVTRISALEHDVDDDDVTTTQRKRTNAALVQTHLPAFEAADILQLGDGSDSTISLGTNAEELFEFAGLEREKESLLRRLLNFFGL
ncbi:hypothetical protein SAMN05421858_5103 [Haladaptatus litoreus]|uniref:DUF7344 domain-containing protein n=1 Tax=Haladaptatus litoreus TaxID=553468 RepID=A0A1N7FIL4_9EURY|nr:hypothetical protein [Haladaptatus litoreus]SIS00189.1 hypothetical protein SAMN05421858_5103 [Haladaptatus litoreus]